MKKVIKLSSNSSLPLLLLSSVYQTENTENSKSALLKIQTICFYFTFTCRLLFKIHHYNVHLMLSFFFKNFLNVDEIVFVSK